VIGRCFEVGGALREHRHYAHGYGSSEQLFKHKKCAENRDHIFSLLALCGDGASVKVNYDSSAGDQARCVLQDCKQSLCLCSTGIHIVAEALQLRARNLGMGKQGMSFAQIQLPVIKQSAQQSSHHIRSSQHSSVVARDSGNTLLHPSTLIALHFSDICPIDSTVLAVELYPDVDLISYQYTDSATHYSYPEVYHREHGCTIEMSDDAQSCTVKFSLEFLVELAQRGIEAALPSCCNRVESVGTQHEGASGHCALRLCENI
jgi:hypothetical protein